MRLPCVVTYPAGTYRSCNPCLLTSFNFSGGVILPFLIILQVDDVCSVLLYYN